MSTTLIVGSVAFDSVKTPAGEVNRALGGSATYAAIAASYFSPTVRLVGIVGRDFGLKNINVFKRRGIDVAGLTISEQGNTFHWQGVYEDDMSQAHTISTCVNVFADFQPQLPEEYRDSKFVFLANIDPELQSHVMKQMKHSALVICDTMNYWISCKRQELLQVLRKADVILLNEAELRQLAEEVNLCRAVQKVLRLGKARWLIVKKGVHGAVVYSRTDQFIVPAYPTLKVKDPTGAGDTFAGGFISWVAYRNRVDSETIRQAAIIGSALASFTIEDFSIRRLYRLNLESISERVDFLLRMLECPPIKFTDKMLRVPQRKL